MERNLLRKHLKRARPIIKPIQQDLVATVCVLVELSNAGIAEKVRRVWSYKTGDLGVNSRFFIKTDAQ